MRRIFVKIGMFILTVLAVSLLVFFAFALIPGDPATTMLGTNASQEKLALLREQLGLNRPIFVRYFEWIRSFFFGNMGISYSYGTSVSMMLESKLPITLTLTLMSFFMIVVISIPLGIYSAKHTGSTSTKIIDITNRIIMSMPPFFTGMLLTYLFGIVFRIFTPGGFVSYDEDFFGFLYYMIFPSLAIALPKAAMNMSLLKTSLLSEAKLDYVRTAYSRGNSSTQVLYRHVLKNALIPVLTFLGMTLADIVAGSLIVEQVFSIPGFGRLLITSIGTRDYPVVQSIITIIAIIVISTNFIVDILYRIVDPRMR